MVCKTVIENRINCVCFKVEEPDVTKDVPEIEEGESRLYFTQGQITSWFFRYGNICHTPVL